MVELFKSVSWGFMNRMRKMISFESKFLATPWPNSTQSLSGGSKPRNANMQNAKRKKIFSIIFAVIHIP